MASPANEISINLKADDKKQTLAVHMACSLLPELDGGLEYTLGQETTLPAPWNCKSVINKTGDNTYVETVTYDDGTVFTHASTNTGHSSTTVTSGKDGYIGKVYLEKVAPCVTGFYVMEKSENLEKMMAEDSGMSLADATKLCSSLALRITKCGDYYTMTDYLGSSSKSLTYKLGEEFAVKDEQLGLAGTNLMVETAPGHYVLTYKDDKGKCSIWEATLTEDELTWKVTKPLNTQTCSLVYRKYPDCFGTWKTIMTNNVSAAVSTTGLPKEVCDAFENDRATHKISYLGDGKIQWDTDGIYKADCGPIIYRSGEEFSYTMQGKHVTEVVCMTKEGMVGSSKIDNMVNNFKAKIGKTFMVMETCVEGRPDTKATVIAAKMD
eukprot:TRINITY_DN4458_c0_g1_i1.p1 TRINITY_DN4458_c0_g1~~TRINITY_DN4458_c0_g1_i1.p1  ORF type:complete len:437 (+),score=145.32 TRINITY_DN4458_c0_g1_i1:174-1313(+)